MRPLLAALVLTMLLGAAPACAQNASFNLSTNQTFSSNEQPKIHLYARNVDALEFRIYRINDPVRFMTNLHDMHSFGHEEGLLPPEQIDERTLLEKFHDWKANLWETIREFFRHQFSHRARAQIRAHQSSVERHSRIVSEAEFAQVPLLNRSQLIARWRQLTPPTFFSDHNTLPLQKLAPGLYLLEATNGHLKAYTVVMVSDIALVTRTSNNGILTFVVDRNTGAPIPGATVQSGVGQYALATATTDADGVASLPTLTDKSQPDNFYVFASRGDQFAASTPSTWPMTFLSTGIPFAGYAFTDRPVYRPSHTVHWKAILRDRSGNTLALPKAKTAHVVISDENDKSVFDHNIPISPEGDVSGDYTLAADASLGYYTLHIGDQPYGGVSASFHVEDYRKPEYRVSVLAKDKRVLEGQTATVKIDSRYFFGEPVANAKVKYRVYHERNWGWFGEDDSGDEDNAAASAAEGTEEDAYNPGDEEAEKTGKLGPDGTMTIQVPTHVDTAGNQHYDLDYVIEAGVTDAANREITGRGRFSATYSTFRIRIEPDRYLVHPGDPIRFNVLALDYDNKPVSTHVHVQLNYYTWQRGQRQVTAGPTTDVQTGADGKAVGTVVATNPPYPYAELDATANAVQPNTPNPTAETSVWIPTANPYYDFGGEQTAQILTDKKSYSPGDTAHLTLVSEDAGLYALILVEGNTLQHRELIHSDNKTASFDVPITADSQPNVNVSAIFLKNGQVNQATKELRVPPRQQELQVAITPSKDTFQPEQTIGYDVLTTDSTGKPIAADISFGVVDEAIYSLHPDSSGDMIRALYPRRFVEANVDSSLDFYFSGTAGDKSPMLAMRNARYRPQLAQVKPGNETKPRVRKAFPDTAFWAPVIHTNADGKAHISFAFPDSLTTWRATVHAITVDSKAGSAINRVLVRKNVIVRMGTPRFLIQGDEITIPVIAHNYLDTSIDAKLSLNVEGLTTISGSPQTVTIPSKGEATVNWRLRASQIGTAKLTASAITGEESDALELSFPINPAGVIRNAAAGGAVAPQATQATATIDFPSGTDPAVHSLRIELSPSIAGSLFSALDYLTSYPYGCTEQTMSSYLPNVIVAETLGRLNVNAHVDPTELRAKMQAGLARLQDYQHGDGGWGWWKEDDSRVFMTAYVVAGLGQGAQFVPLTNEQRAMLESGTHYLHQTLAEHERMRPELRAAVVYALAMSGDSDIKHALDEQFNRRNDLDPEPLAMTGLAMLAVHDSRAQQIAALLESKTTRQGDLAYWKGSYTPLLDYDYDNSVEATAFAMRLLARVNPNDPLLPGVAQWLMLERNGGYWWYSTEQTAMVLFGLVDYLAASHELDADYTVDVLVNGASAGTHHFTAADITSGASFILNIDAAHLQPNHNTIQIIRRSGQGRIYWSAVGRYFSTSKKDYQAGTLNLNLTRDYFTLVPTQKDGKIVYSLKPFSGTAQVGDVLAVHESISGTPERYLMLEDPIPAGAEFIANEDSYPIEARPGGWFYWYTRHEYHDDHAAFFSDDFTKHQEIFYLIRIVNRGSFTVSPASVEPMYQPGISATTDSLHIDVPALTPAGGTQ